MKYLLLIFGLLTVTARADVNFSGVVAQSISANSNGCGTSSCVTTLTLTPNVIVGNSVVCTVAWFSTFSSLTSSLTNTYNAVGSTQTDSSSQSVRLYYSNITHAGSEVLTLTTGGFSTLSCGIYSTTLTLDQSSGQIGTSSPVTCPSITTSQNGELVVNGGVEHGNTAWAAGGSYTLRTSYNGGSGGTPAGLQDQTQSTAGAISGAFAGQTGISSYACVIASFEPTSGFNTNASGSVSGFVLNGTSRDVVVSLLFNVPQWTEGFLFQQHLTAAVNAAPGNYGIWAHNWNQGSCTTLQLTGYYIDQINGSGVPLTASVSAIALPSVNTNHHLMMQINPDAGTAVINLWLDGVLQTPTTCNISNSPTYEGLCQDGGAGACSTTLMTGIYEVGTGDPNYSRSAPLTGTVSQLAIWNDASATTTTLTKLAQSLMAGVQPWYIDKNFLSGYWPLWTFSATEPEYSGNVKSMVLTGGSTAQKLVVINGGNK